MAEAFSLYHIANGTRGFRVGDTNLSLRALAPQHFNFFYKVCLEGRDRRIASNRAVSVFQQCKQYGGAMSLCDSSGVLCGIVWLTQRDAELPHFDIAVKFLEPTDYIKYFRQVLDSLVEGLESLGYADIVLHTSTLDVSTADALRSYGFEMQDAKGLHGECTWIWRKKENIKKEVAMLGLSL